MRDTARPAETAAIRITRTRLSPFPQQSRLLASPVTGFLILPLVDEFSSPRDGDEDFRLSGGVEIQAKGNERHSLSLGFLPQLRELLFADQELSPAALFVSEAPGHLVACDVPVDQEEFTVFDAGVAFGDIGLSIPE